MRDVGIALDFRDIGQGGFERLHQSSARISQVRKVEDKVAMRERDRDIQRAPILRNKLER